MSNRQPPEYFDYSECMEEVQYRAEVVKDLVSVINNEIMNRPQLEDDPTGTLALLLDEQVEKLIKWTRGLPPLTFIRARPKPTAPAEIAVDALEALVTSTYGILPPEGKARFCSYMAGFLEREVVQA